MSVMKLDLPEGRVDGFRLLKMGRIQLRSRLFLHVSPGLVWGASGQQLWIHNTSSAQVKRTPFHRIARS